MAKSRVLHIVDLSNAIRSRSYAFDTTSSAFPSSFVWLYLTYLQLSVTSLAMVGFDYTKAYRVGVAHYERNEGQPYHWAILLRTESLVATFYQIKGYSGHFYLDEFSKHKYFTRSGSWRGALEIGIIEANDLQRFEQVILDTPIRNDEGDNWNCQSWVISALRRLKDAGILKGSVGISQLAILNELRDIEVDYNNGDGYFCESDDN